MIKIGDINGIDMKYDENWILVRSVKMLPEYAAQVAELSPSVDLFCKFQEAAKSNKVDKNWFDEVYAPQYIKELKTNSKAVKMLAKLWDDSKTKTIYLCCYCHDECLCHRSIIAGMLLGSGAKVECENEYAKYWKIYNEC